MPSFRHSRFGKRLRDVYGSPEIEELPDRKRRRIDPHSPINSPSRPQKSKVLPKSSARLKNASPFRLKTPPRIEIGDRFVPSRKDNIQASYNLDEEARSCTLDLFPNSVKDRCSTDCANDLYKSVLRSEFTSSPSTPRRIFTYHSPQNSLPESKVRLNDPTDDTYQFSPLHSQTRELVIQSRSRRIREVPRAPYRALAVPDLPDDFYTSLLDWSPGGTLGVGLLSDIYMWRSDTCESTALCMIPDEMDSYSALAWMQTVPIMALGTYDGHLEVYDASTRQLVRRYQNAHNDQNGNNCIGSISWTSNVFSSGSGDRSVKHWDYRDSSAKPFKQSNGHKREVCGVKWNTDGGVHSSLLASGGADTRVCIWDLRGSMRESGSTAGSNSSSSQKHGKVDGGRPLYEFTKHRATVKGLAWDPHNSSILASGGGAQDRCIRIWNTTTGTMLNEVDTLSQVCNLVWSVNSRELVSTHGFSPMTSGNQICIWGYPSMSRVCCLSGHRERVQHVALSPDGDTIVTASSDQSMCFWNILPGKTSVVRSGDSILDYGKLIR
ncbi:WD40 repeat-like protein [Lentinula aciculospora]|uniref:WD40 repeat-like protein n=1 Tax=Lentinula aciculospora TaxID=153920 RepID=A0A9W9DNE2_9AGAR|nr:WD40 repeat-like protein [Lentinula aciculospora]KAJ4487628.1 WD40 repeat-like protein [Lentinula aciculospora]